MKNCRKVLLPLRESKITVILFSGCNPTGHSKLFALDSIIVHDNCTTNKSLMHQSGKGSLKFKSFFSCFLFKLSVWGCLVIKIVCFGLSWWFMGIYTYHRILTIFAEYLEPTCWKEKTLIKVILRSSHAFCGIEPPSKSSQNNRCNFFLLFPQNLYFWTAKIFFPLWIWVD